MYVLSYFDNLEKQILMRMTTAQLVEIYPHLSCTEVMTRHEFDTSFFLFVQAFAPEVNDRRITDKVEFLTRYITAAISYGNDHPAPLIDELADSLRAIGSAAITLIQFEAIQAGVTFIHPNDLEKFVTRFNESRRFVQLNYTGDHYVIVA